MYFGKKLITKKKIYSKIKFIAKKIIIILSNFFLYIFIIPILVPIVLLIRLIKPIVHIRFRYISTQELGHFVDDASIILAERCLANTKIKDCFWLQSKPSNKFFIKMIKRKFFIRWWVKYLFITNNLLPGGQSFVEKQSREKQGSRDLDLALYKTKNDKNAYFYFTEEENEIGKKFLEKLGIKEGEKFVCLAVRDNSYKSKVWPDLDWSYHNHRNSDIDSYAKGSIELANRGYWLLRMGKFVSKKFNCKHDRVIDYSSMESRSDFLDIWLMANCSFCVTTSTGIDSVATAFRKPILYLNFLPIADIVSYANATTYLKNLKYKKGNKKFNLKEYLVNNFYNYHDYQKKNIDIIDMSEEEIKFAMIEMHEKFIGTFKESNKAIELQKKFWEIFLKWDKENPRTSKFKYGGTYKSTRHKFPKHPNAKISSTFLSNNLEWL